MRSNWPEISRAGVDIDYQATVSGAGPTVFASDTTYFVSGNVYLTGAVTMEAAVFKFPTSSGSIEIENTLALATTNYRTAIFTSADDNTAGTPLNTGIWSGYTGTNSGDRYGGAALWLNTSANIALNNLRFCYMNIAIEIGSDTAGQKLTLSNLQMVDCFEGVYVYGSSNTNASLIFNMYNCLMADVGTPFVISGAALAGGGCNCTVDACTNLFSVGTTSGTFNFTNSIISTLTSKGTLGIAFDAGRDQQCILQQFRSDIWDLQHACFKPLPNERRRELLYHQQHLVSDQRNNKHPRRAPGAVEAQDDPATVVFVHNRIQHCFNAVCTTGCNRVVARMALRSDRLLLFLRDSKRCHVDFNQRSGACVL